MTINRLIEDTLRTLDSLGVDRVVSTATAVEQIAAKAMADVAALDARVKGVWGSVEPGLFAAGAQKSLQQLLGLGDLPRGLFESNAALMTAKQIEEIERLVGITSKLDFASIANAHAEVLSLVAEWDVAETVRADLRDSLPGIPTDDDPQTLERWRRALVQWWLDAVQHARTVNPVVVLVGWLVAQLVQMPIDHFAEQELRREIAEIRDGQKRSAEQIAALTSPPTVRIAVTARPSHVYAGPNTSMQSFAKLAEATAVTVIECEEQWCRVEYFDRAQDIQQQGWVYKPRLTFFSAR